MPFTINSDDPVLFDVSLSAEYSMVSEIILDPSFMLAMVKTQRENPLLPPLSEKKLAAAEQKIIDVMSNSH
jgi:hypothetical protein